MANPLQVVLKAGLFTGLLTVLFVGGAPLNAAAQSPQETVLKTFESQLQTGESFSATRGEALFRDTFSGGKPENPTCTSCHSTSPQKAGKTKAGKVIEPMAFSKTAIRYADQGKVDKWFRRNCKTVLGRECTALEKGDFLTFMLTQ